MWAQRTGILSLVTRTARQSCLSAILIAISAGQTCIAVDAQPAQASDSALAEIIVVAQKRRENLEDVPIAITALSPKVLSQFQVNDITGLSKIAPNTIIQPISVEPTSVSVFIRGIGAEESTLENEGPNSIALDGVYLIGIQGAVLDTFDLDHVEVLRGPQGTLQGRNAVGGAVLFYSSRPSLTEPEGKVELGFGNYSNETAKLVVSTPIIKDVLAVKLAFMSTNFGGYLRDISNGEMLSGDEKYSAKGSVLFKPTEGMEFYLSADYIKDRAEQRGHSADDNINYAPPVQVHTFQQTVSVLCSVFAKCTPDANWITSSTYTPPTVLKGGGVALNSVFDLGATQLTSVTGYRSSTEHQNVDLDASSVPEFFVRDQFFRQNQESEELRLASQKGGGADLDGKLDWVAGVYAVRQYIELVHSPVYLNSLASGIPTAACEALAAAGGVLPPGSGPLTGIISGAPGCYLDLNAGDQQTLKSFAAFLHADFNITDQLVAFGGVRNTHDHKYFNQGTGVGGPQGISVGYSAPFDYSSSWGNTSGDVGLRYNFTSDVNAYLHFSQGYRAGGFNSDGLAHVADTFNPETVNAIELGVKSELFDRRLQVNAAVFNNQYTNMQVIGVHFLDNQVLQSTTNAAKAHIRGIEIEALARPIPALQAQLTIATLDARYTQWQIGQFDESTLRLPFTPKFSATAALDYTWHLPVPLMSKLTAGIDSEYKTAYTPSPNDLPLTAQGSYDITNANIVLSDESDKYYITLWGTNLANVHYIANGEIDSNLNHFQVEGPPRMYGVRIGAKF